MSSTRTVRIGECTVVIAGVPDGVDEDVLKSLALMKLYQMSRKKAIEEMMGFHKAG